MVRNKQMHFWGQQQGHSSRPQFEPENMVNVELNNKDNMFSLNEKPSTRNIWVKLSITLFGITLLTCTALAMAYCLYKISDGEEQQTGWAADNELREIIATHRNELLTCKLTREYDDCCFILGKMEGRINIEDCSVDKILEIILNDDNANLLEDLLISDDINDKKLTLKLESNKLHNIDLQRKKRHSNDQRPNFVMRKSNNKNVGDEAIYAKQIPFDYTNNYLDHGSLTPINIENDRELQKQKMRTFISGEENESAYFDSDSKIHDTSVQVNGSDALLFLDNTNVFVRKSHNDNKIRIPNVDKGDASQINISSRELADEEIGGKITEARISGNEFQTKPKMQEFSGTNEPSQSNQQFSVNPTFQKQCIPYMNQFSSTYPIMQQQIPYGHSGIPKYSQILTYAFPGLPRTNSYYLAPTQYNYMVPLPQTYTASLPAVPNQFGTSYAAYYPSNHNAVPTSPGQTPVSNNGKYFLCNPVSDTSNNVASIPGVEIRNGMGVNLQDMVGSTLRIEEENNKTRASDLCPVGENMCADDSKCIKAHNICDGEVHCDDASDEADCSCKFRVGSPRWCDGYFDCPFGEDELGCFGCEGDSISCDDWSDDNKLGSCISINERCDGVVQCPTGKDEQDCSLLTKQLGEDQESKFSGNVGFLHRNYKGKWYPVCSNVEMWAKEACDAESGPSELPPLTHLIPVKIKHKGSYISALPNNRIELVKSCVHGRAVYVECPQPTCGMREITRNQYREEEVDTSAEKIISRYSRMRRVLNDAHILGNSRVVGGKPSQPGAWPWVVSIYRNGIFHCGGAIVSPSWIITAAHCVDKYWKYYYEIEAGVLRRFSYCPMQQTRIAASVVTQPEYDRANLKNDLALIKLSSSLNYNRYIRPVCMPSEITAGQNFLRNPAPGTICTAVGWGATEEHGFDPDHLREVEVPILSQCKHTEDEIGDGICAGLIEGGKDACQGDSGGPFLCRNPNFPTQWYLAGIVSHGEGCARPNEPGVYTRVSKYIDWIYNYARDDRLPKRKPLQQCPGYICNLTKKCIPKKRRCDKYVDCLTGDDEQNCEHGSFKSLFNHALRNMFVGAPQNVSGSPNSGEIFTSTNSPTSITIDDITSKIAKSADNIFDTFKMESSSTADSMNINGFGFIGDGTSFASSPRLSDENRYISNTEGPTTADTGVTTKNYGVDESSSEFVSTTAAETSDSPWTESNTIDNLTPTNFLCKNILQVVPLKHRCDRIADCEDATDEENCQCVDYLRSSAPHVICDGFTDCYDLSDEENCSSCERSLEYYCPKSNVCIPISSRCNDVLDCVYGEDERDCFGLTNGTVMEVDEDLRPVIRLSGVVVFNGNGMWKPLCANWTHQEPSIAADICLSMSFSDYKKFFQLSFSNKQLNVKIKGSSEVMVENPNTDVGKCNALYVECSNKSFDLTYQTTHESKFNAANELYAAPWNAAIYANGEYQCTGILLNFRWVFTTDKCFQDILRLYQIYVSALLGSFRGYLNVGGPHDQVIRVVESVKVGDSGVVLLRLEKDIEFTRYVRPLQFQWQDRPVQRKETCYAVGLDENQKLTNVFLKSLEGNCPQGYKCLRRISETKEDCTLIKRKSIPWSGTIVCDSGNGLYPAALFYDTDGECGFQKNSGYISVNSMKREILNAMDDPEYITFPPRCITFRCKIGICLNSTQVCDGIADCPDGLDEDVSYCKVRRQQCHLTKDCGCLKSELKCANGNCISKTAFCDSVDDCGDGSDEPKTCSCRAYLQLGNEEKICDGDVNCHDSSDEKGCSCTKGQFECPKTDTCISKDMVCDGYVDCPNEEDENQCLSLVSIDGRTDAGEVISQTSGTWHRGCFSDMLSQRELEDICRKIGLSSENAVFLYPPTETVNMTARKPVFGSFSLLKLHDNIGLNIAIRSGRGPYITFINDPDCHRLFIECL